MELPENYQMKSGPREDQNSIQSSLAFRCSLAITNRGLQYLTKISTDKSAPLILRNPFRRHIVHRGPYNTLKRK